jgi:hypothetical protein
MGFWKQLSTTGKGMIEGAAVTGQAVLPLATVLNEHANAWAINAKSSSTLSMMEHQNETEKAMLDLMKSGYDPQKSSKTIDECRKALGLEAIYNKAPDLKSVA